MNKPDFSKLAAFLKPASLSLRKFVSLNKQRPMILVGALALVAVLVLGLLLVELAVSRGGKESAAKPVVAGDYSLEGVKVVRELYMPGPAIGETPFPLAFEPDPGYTDQGLRERYNDMHGVDVADLEARRKAELEAIYDALD